MTDNEIIKALECCKKNEKHSTCEYCKECPASWCDLKDNEDNCYDVLYSRSIDLILRQQAEIKKLKTENERVKTNIYKMAIDKALAEKARAEAIKEFAERLKANIGDEDFYVQDKLLLMSMIDNLVKEMGCGE